MSIALEECQTKALKIAYSLEKLSRESWAELIQNERKNAESDPSLAEQLDHFIKGTNRAIDDQLKNNLRAFDLLLHFIAEDNCISNRYNEQIFSEELARAAAFCSSERFNQRSFANWAKQRRPPYELLGFSPASMEQFDEIGELLANAGKFDEAASIYQLLTTLDPRPVNWFKWGLAAIEAGQFAKALEPFIYLQIGDSDSPIPLYYQAICYYGLQDFQQADNTLNDALEMCRKDPAWHETELLCLELKKSK